MTTTAAERFKSYVAGLARVRAELAARLPFLEAVFERLAERLEFRPLKLIEIHGGWGQISRAERRRVEPRLEPLRQALTLVAGALLVSMDLASLRVGTLRSDGIFSGIGQESIAKLTGLGLGRIRRALHDLVEAGYVTAHQPIERYVRDTATGPETGHCAHFSIYRLAPLFFTRLHFDKRLKRERKSASDRRAERVRLYGASLVRARAAVRLNRRTWWIRSTPPTPPTPRPPRGGPPRPGRA